MVKRTGEESPYDPPIHIDIPRSHRGNGGNKLGINLRLLDNVLQAACIAVSTFLGGMIGALDALPSGIQVMVRGAMIGSFLGLLTGLLGSGIFLMFYRSGRGSDESAD